MRVATIAIATFLLFLPVVLIGLLFAKVEFLEFLGLFEWFEFYLGGSALVSYLSYVYISKQVEDWRPRLGLTTAKIAISATLMVLSVFGFFYLLFVAEAELSLKVIGLFFALPVVGILGQYVNQQLVARAELQAEVTEREPEQRPIELRTGAIDGRMFFFGWLGVGVLLNLYWVLSGGPPSVEGQPPWTVGQRIGFTFGISLFLWIVTVASFDTLKGVWETLRRLRDPSSVWPELPVEHIPAHFDEFRDAAFGPVNWFSDSANENFKITIGGLMSGLSLSGETLGSAVSKRVTGADIEVGDPAFDDAALIRGDVLEVLSRLDAGQRALIPNFLALQGSIQDGQLEFFIPNRGGALGRPEADDVRRLAEGFQEKTHGSIEHRLLAMLSEDPSPSVRDKVLTTMIRYRVDLELDLDELLIKLIRGKTYKLAKKRGKRKGKKVSIMTEPEARAALGISGTAAVAAAFWLRENGESRESIEALSLYGDDALDELSVVAGQAIAAIRSRLGEFAGGLALSESQDAGALSLAEQGGQLALSEDGQPSVSEEEAERKGRGAEERQKG